MNRVRALILQKSYNAIRYLSATIDLQKHHYVLRHVGHVIEKFFIFFIHKVTIIVEKKTL